MYNLGYNNSIFLYNHFLIGQSTTCLTHWDQNKMDSILKMQFLKHFVEQKFDILF